MCAASPHPNQFRQQDGQVIVRMAPTHEKSHPQHRWDRRVDGEWAGESVRAIWRVAEPVDLPSARSGTYARYHPPTDTVLLATYGILDTVIPLSRRPSNEQQYVREQVHE